MICPRLHLWHTMVAFFHIIILFHYTTTNEITNFITNHLLYDGELETFIYYDGISAKETTVTKG